METVLRIAFAYVFVLFVLRIMGKREFGELSPVELVMLLLIPELVSQGIVREDFSMTNAVIAIATLAALVFTASVVTYRFPRISAIVDGRPSLLVREGEPVSHTMDRERIPIEELASQMRKAGVERLDEVKWAVVEAGGQISIIRYGPQDVRPDSGRRLVK